MDVNGALRSCSGRHPRILVNPNSFNIENAHFADEDLRYGLYERIITIAAKELSSEPVKFTAGIKGLSSVTNGLISRILNLAVAFRFTGDHRFAERVRTELLAVVEFPDWDPIHFLDCAQISFIVAIGYDWIYETLSPQERSTIVDALYRNCLQYADMVYKQPFVQDKDPNRKPLSWVNWVAVENNWNQVVKVIPSSFFHYQLYCHNRYAMQDFLPPHWPLWKKGKI
jgi:hypothetical protein